MGFIRGSRVHKIGFFSIFIVLILLPLLLWLLLQLISRFVIIVAGHHHHHHRHGHCRRHIHRRRHCDHHHLLRHGGIDFMAGGLEAECLWCCAYQAQSLLTSNFESPGLKHRRPKAQAVELLNALKATSCDAHCRGLN